VSKKLLAGTRNPAAPFDGRPMAADLAERIPAYLDQMSTDRPAGFILRRKIKQPSVSPQLSPSGTIIPDIVSLLRNGTKD
jgi:hypothetical protein